MQVYATLKNLRISPTKVRLVTEKIKKMKPSEAINILSFIPNSSAKPLKKVISSAISNAKNNHGLKEDSLFIKEIVVNKGPAFKRFKAIARGRAHSILKRTSHVRVVLEEKVQEKETPLANKVESKDASKAEETTIKALPAKSKGVKNGPKS